jgi:uncharacterized membrane protein YdbT with pleckstrin-like domain
VISNPPSKAQKKKLAKLLSQGEEVVYVTTIGRRYFYLALLFLLVIPLALTYVAIFMFFDIISIPNYSYIKYFGIFPLIFLIYNTPKFSHLIRMRQSFTYALTNRRFLIVRGIFSRKIVTAPLTAITHVTVEQSFFQRFLFNTGHLVIITAGFDQREIVIENIGNPLEFKILIEELTESLEGSRSSHREVDDSKNDEFKLRSLNS